MGWDRAFRSVWLHFLRVSNFPARKDILKQLNEGEKLYCKDKIFLRRFWANIGLHDEACNRFLHFLPCKIVSTVLLFVC